MGKKKIAKKTTTDKQKMPTPRVERTQQNLKQEKRVRSREILEKEEPKEPPQKTRAIDMVSPRKGVDTGKKATPPNPHRLAYGGPGLAPKMRKPSRINWDFQLTRIFLELAVKEIEEEGRATTLLSNKSLDTISKKLSALTNQDINKVQCKNRYSQLRRDWQAWQLLANTQRGTTGLGFDPDLRTYTAPDFMWSNLIVQNEHVAKFRDRPLDHEDLMQRVFQAVTATGKYVYIHGQPSRVSLDPYDILDDSSDLGVEGQGEGAGMGFTVGIDVGEEVGIQLGPPVDAYDTPSSARAMPICLGCDSSGSKRKTPSSGTDEISQLMETMLRNMEKDRRHKHYHYKSSTLGEVATALSQLPYFNQLPRLPIYWWVYEYMKDNVDDRDFFISCGTVEGRLEFLRYLHGKAAAGPNPPPPFDPEE